MNMLRLISDYSYIAYIILGVILLVIIIRILGKIKLLTKNIEPISDGVKNINENIETFNNKKAIIDNTTQVSIPFFMRFVFYYEVIRFAFKDYKDTKYSKRSIRKSFNKAYRYQSLIRENKQLRKS